MDAVCRAPCNHTRSFHSGRRLQYIDGAVLRDGPKTKFYHTKNVRTTNVDTFFFSSTNHPAPRHISRILRDQTTRAPIENQLYSLSAVDPECPCPPDVCRLLAMRHVATTSSAVFSNTKPRLGKHSVAAPDGQKGKTGVGSNFRHSVRDVVFA